jgi:hypothetical protein
LDTQDRSGKIGVFYAVAHFIVKQFGEKKHSAEVEAGRGFSLRRQSMRIMGIYSLCGGYAA